MPNLTAHRSVQRGRCAKSMHDYRLVMLTRVPLRSAVGMPVPAGKVFYRHRCSGCGIAPPWERT